MKLDILFQYGGRKYIEQIARHFLAESLTCENVWHELDCSRKSIGEGFNELARMAKNDYVLWTPDDFGFFPNGDWADMAMDILDKRQDIGIIDLRKERDNETPWSIDHRAFIGDQSFFIVKRWEDRGFNLTPFIMRRQDLLRIIPLDESGRRKNGAEWSGIENFKQLNLQLARLDVPYLGVCFHLGWNRSKELGYEG